MDLRDVQFLAMDWCTNERLPVHCFVQNKEVSVLDLNEETIVAMNNFLFKLLHLVYKEFGFMKKD